MSPGESECQSIVTILSLTKVFNGTPSTSLEESKAGGSEREEEEPVHDGLSVC